MTKKIIYTVKFVEQLKQELGTAEAFHKLSFSEKKKISDKIKKIFAIEEFQRSYSYNSLQYTYPEIDKLLTIEKGEFIKKVNEELSKKIKRINSASFKNNIKTVIKDIINLLIEKNPIIIDLNEDLIDSLINDIDSYNIFIIVISSILEKCKKRSEFTNIHDEDHIDTETVVVSHEFIKALKIHFLKYLINLILKKIDLKKIKLLELLESIESNIIMGNKYLSLIIQIELISEVTIFSRTDQIFINDHLNNIHIIPKKISDYKPIIAHLPEIIKPCKWNTSEFENVEFVKKIKDGVSNIDYSNLTIKALELSQDKEMIISENAINLFKDLDKLSVEEYNLIDISPMIPISVLIDQQNKNLINKKNKIKKNDYKKIQNIKNHLYKDKKFTEELFFDEIYQKLNISREQYYLNENYITELKKYKVMINQREIFNSVLLMAEIFKGFPIYFLNTIDYRLRIYPWSFLFSRTTGVYKYFLKDLKLIKLNNEGFNCMLEAYYYSDNVLFEKYSKIIKNEDEMKLFFKQNKIKLFNTSNYIYFKLLEIEIEDAILNKMKTNFMIEVDQKTSCSVFLSIVLKNNKLAEFSNLIDSELKDIPKYLSSRTEDFLKSNLIYNERILNEFLNKRILHKKAFMTFCYNQEAWGRKNDWIEILNDLTENEKLTLINFSQLYENLLDKSFPGLIQQKEILNDLALLIIKNKKKITLKTLDGTIIDWQIKKKSYQIIKVLNPITNKYISYRKTIYSDLVDVKKMRTSFIPGFIHSIDASVIRILILKMYKHKYIINHIHDCIMLHPNYLPILYLELNKLYLDKKLFDDLVFNNFIKLSLDNLNDDVRDLVLNKYKEFQKLEQNIDPIKFEIKNMYPYEK